MADPIPKPKSKRRRRNERQKAVERGKKMERDTDARYIVDGFDEGEGVLLRKRGMKGSDVARQLGEVKFLVECKKRDGIVSKTLMNWLDQVEARLGDFAEVRWPVIEHEDSPGPGRGPALGIISMRREYWHDFLGQVALIIRQRDSLLKINEEMRRSMGRSILDDLEPDECWRA